MCWRSAVQHFRSIPSFFCYFRLRFSVENQIVVCAIDCIDGEWIDRSRCRTQTSRKWKIVCGWREFSEGQARRSRTFWRCSSGARASSKSNCRTPWICGTDSTCANRSLVVLCPSHAIRSFGTDYPCASLPFGPDYPPCASLSFGANYTFGSARASCSLACASLSKTLGIGLI